MHISYHAIVIINQLIAIQPVIKVVITIADDFSIMITSTLRILNNRQ